jgi:hypothetical protein
MYIIQDLKKNSILLGLVFIRFPNRGGLSAAPCTKRTSASNDEL